MKNRLLPFLFVLISLVSAQAGPHVSVVVNAGGGYGGFGRSCGPAFYTPQAYFTPFFYPYAYSYWGSAYYGASSVQFSTVSPMMNYGSDTPVIRVPPPVLQAEPLTVYPGVSFGFRK